MNKEATVEGLRRSRQVTYDSDPQAQIEQILVFRGMTVREAFVLLERIKDRLMDNPVIDQVAQKYDDAERDILRRA